VRLDILQLGPSVPAFNRWLGNAIFVVVIGALAWRTHREVGRFTGDRELWQQTLAADPDSWMAEFQLGRYDLNDGNAQRASDRLARAAELRPEMMEIRQDYGLALFRLGRYRDAEPEYLAAIKLAPPDKLAAGWHNYGILLSRTGRSDDALDAFRRAVALDPKQPELRFDLARCLANRGDRDGAVSEARNAREWAHGELAAEIDRWLGD
jgi:Flp pilus assembly protein TadD